MLAADWNDGLVEDREVVVASLSQSVPMYLRVLLTYTLKQLLASTFKGQIRLFLRISSYYAGVTFVLPLFMELGFFSGPTRCSLP